MALVAYSDESDMSEEEEEEKDADAVPLINKSVIHSKSNTPAAPTTSGTDVERKSDGHTSSKTNNKSDHNTAGSANGFPAGVDGIIDDDDFLVPGPSNIISPHSKLLSALPAKSRVKLGYVHSAERMSVLEDDLITDVPTKDTWKISKDLIEKRATASNNNNETNNKKNSVSNDRNSKNDGSSDNTSSSAFGRPVLGKAAQIGLASSALGSLLQKRRTPGGKVQMVLPAMSEFIEEEEDEIAEPVVKTVVASLAGTGLLTMLPKPKHSVKGKELNRSLVPHILSKPPPKKTLPQNKHIKKPITTIKSDNKAPKTGKASTLGVLDEYEDSDDDDMDSDNSRSDFFSLDAKINAAPVSLPVDDSLIVNEVDQPSVRIPNPDDNIVSANSFKTNLSTISPTYSDTVYDNSNTNVISDEEEIETNDVDNADFIPVKSPDRLDPSQMDDAAYRRLTGKKRKNETLDIIDFNADDALLSREEWMNLAASEEKPVHSHSKKKGNMPSQQQKRKHQITYLAHQAKEREVELKNEWSAGKLKKQQTRSKYGF